MWRSLISFFSQSVSAIKEWARRAVAHEKIQYFARKVTTSLKAIASSFVQSKRLAIFQACLIGIVSGLAAVFLKQGIGWLSTWRIAATQIIPPLFLLPAVGLIGGFLAGWLVQTFAPETSGSGIPQVKAALAGVRISLSLRVAVVKLIGTIFTVGSGLTLGRQGPTIQIGASLAAWISQWLPTSPNYRRQLIACGAAAGLAAGFNAPIAGVLFVVEDLLQDVSGVTLGPAIIASFVGAVVSQLLGGRGVDLETNTLQIVDTISPGFVSLKEIPFYAILGILAGVGGALFSRGIISASKFNQRIRGIPLPWRMAIAGLICGLVVALLPSYFRNSTGLREFLGSGEAGLTTTAIALIAHFLLTIVAASSGAPGGLFAPSLIMGSALGHLVGLGHSELMGVSEPATFALTGMGAFFCAVSRAPMTAVVIVFEIVSDFNLVLPLMIGSIVSYLVAEKIDKKSLLDRLWELKGIQLKKQKLVEDSLTEILAEEVMVRQVETLPSHLTLDEVKQAFSHSPHRGFPVVDKIGKLVGIITQTDLLNTNKRDLPGDTLLKEFMTAQPVSVNPTDNLTEVLYQLNRYNLSRLPVVEGRKLLGIITRSDIIRAESNQLLDEVGSEERVAPSYLVYQKRGPAIGSGRLLVPLSNPNTASALLNLAVAIASARNYELECLQVMLVPSHSSPAETPVNIAQSLVLLRKAEEIAKKNGVSVHTQIRAARDIGGAILDTIKERHIRLLLMGWTGEYSASGQIFGNVVDTLIRQASCEVVVVKWGFRYGRVFANNARQENPPQPPLERGEKSGNRSGSAIERKSFVNGIANVGHYENIVLGWRRWLVPIRSNPREAAAVQLLPALVRAIAKPEIRLCQVFGKSSIQAENNEGIELGAKILSRRLNAEVIPISVCASSVSEAIIDLADKNQCDVVVLGASREGFLTRVVNGNIPEAIARGCNCTVILVRGVN